MISFFGVRSPEADVETRICGKCFIKELLQESRKPARVAREAELCPSGPRGAPSKLQMPLHWIGPRHSPQTYTLTNYQNFWLNLEMSQEQDSYLRESYVFPLKNDMLCDCRLFQRTRWGHSRPGNQVARFTSRERDRWTERQNSQELESSHENSYSWQKTKEEYYWYTSVRSNYKEVRKEKKIETNSMFNLCLLYFSL